MVNAPLEKSFLIFQLQTSMRSSIFVTELSIRVNKSLPKNRNSSPLNYLFLLKNLASAKLHVPVGPKHHLKVKQCRSPGLKLFPFTRMSSPKTSQKTFLRLIWVRSQTAARVSRQFIAILSTSSAFLI